MTLLMYALVNSALNPLPDTVLCVDHFDSDNANRVAAATAEDYLGWRPVHGPDHLCTVCQRGEDAISDDQSLRVRITFTVEAGSLAAVQLPIEALLVAEGAHDIRVDVDGT